VGLVSTACDWLNRSGIPPVPLTMVLCLYTPYIKADTQTLRSPYTYTSIIAHTARAGYGILKLISAIMWA